MNDVSFGDTIAVRGKRKYCLEKNLPQPQFIHHKLHMDWSETEHGLAP